MANTLITTIPTIMAAGLVRSNLRKKKKKLTGLAVDNIVGVSMIQATAQAGSW